MRAGPQTSFLASTGEDWQQGCSFANIQRANPFGSVKFMCTQGKQVHVQFLGIDCLVSGCLDGVRMEWHILFRDTLLQFH